MAEVLDFPARFELNYPGGPELVPVVRRFAFDLCNKVVPGQPELASAVSLAAHELLDNATRHGARREALLRLEFVSGPPWPQVRVSVAGPVQPAQLEALARSVTEAMAAPDARAYYHEQMRAVAESRPGAGLGLARLRAEANLSLYLELGGTRVTVYAQSPGLPDPRQDTSPRLTIPPAGARPPTGAGLPAARPSTLGGLATVRPSTLGNLAPVRPSTPAAQEPKEGSRPPTLPPPGSTTKE